MATITVSNLQEHEIIKKGQYEEYDTVNLVIPANIRVIEKEAFAGFRKLETVKFEKGSMIEVIDERAFCVCKSLKSIVFPKSLREIGKEAFQMCDVLGSITFEKDNKLEVVGESAFAWVGRYCFGEKKSSAVVFSSCFNFLGKKAFLGCEGVFNSFDFKKVLYLKRIPKEAFKSCRGAKVIMPTSGCITEICDSAFEGAGVSITMPASGISSIGNKAFANSSIEEFDFRGVKVIGDFAFHCSELKTAIIPTDCKIGIQSFSTIGNKCQVYRKDLPLLEPYDSSSSDIGSEESISDKLRGLFGRFKK